MHRFSAPGLLFLTLFAGGCSSEPLERTLRIVTGLETDTFSAAPAVTKVRIEARTNGNDVFAAEAVPGGAFDLGDIPYDEPLAIEVTGTSADGLVVVRGRSLSAVLPSAFATEDVPVFVQRVSTWARPSGALDRAHVDGPACVLGERFVATTGGSLARSEAGEADATIGDYYDLLAWNSAVSSAFPFEAKSLVGRYDGMLVVGDSAAVFATADASPTTVPLPSGLNSFADVAGGYVVDSPAGTSFVIGGTRGGDTPAQGVLSFGSDGLVKGLSLVQARMGAAAVWAEGVGLVVAGGSATGTGFELIPEGQTAFVARDLPADPTTGAAAVALSKERMLLIGGVTGGLGAPTRTWDPSCVSGCSMMDVVGAELPVALVKSRGFSLGGSRVLVVGHEATGQKLVRVFEVDVDKPLVVERPLREARSGATVVPAPNGTLAILGGLHEDGTPALNVEMFFP